MNIWSNMQPLWKEILLINAALENTLTSQQVGQRSIWKSAAENYAQIMGHPFDSSESAWLLKYLPQLKKVDCSGTEVSQLPPELAKLELNELYCGRTPLTEINELIHQPSLKKLCLFDTLVTNLSPLQNIEALERLCCARTQVISLEPLRHLTHLRVLSISNTGISNLEPLTNLSELESVRCDGTHVSPDEIEAFQKRHPNCKVFTEPAAPDWDDFAD